MENPSKSFSFVCQQVVKSTISTRDYSLIYSLLMDPEYGVMDNLMPHTMGHIPQLMKASAMPDPDTPNIGAALSGPH